MHDDDDARARALLQGIPALQRQCDLDLLMFFAKHPRTLMGSEQLARLLGYALAEIAQSLEVLIGSGLLTRTQNPARRARMYVFAPDPSAAPWLPGLVTFASARAGRLALRRALTSSTGAGTNGLPALSENEAPDFSRPFLVRRKLET